MGWTKKEMFEQRGDGRCHDPASDRKIEDMVTYKDIVERCLFLMMIGSTGTNGEFIKVEAPCFRYLKENRRTSSRSTGYLLPFTVISRGFQDRFSGERRGEKS